MQYKTKEFNIPDLKGLSAKQLEVHLGLYGGYVKHVNLVREIIHDLENADKEKNAYTIAELRRRFSFEFDGMRMHEYYFEGFEGGAKEIDGGGSLAKAVGDKYGDWNGFLEHFKTIGGGTRGIGWTVLYWDQRGQTPHTVWAGDHELGHLAGLPVILAMDMWEHAYMVDYIPAEKKEYIEAFFNNLNWSVAEERFKNTL